MALPRMSALATIGLLVVAAFVWVVGVVATQVITREVDWWAPRLEALLASVAALIAPPKHRRKGLRRQWRAELDFDRAPGETRVLMAAAFAVASIHMWRRPPQDDDAAVVEIHAADGATVTDAAGVIPITAAIAATSEVSGGLTAHGVLRVSGSASLGSVRGLAARGVARTPGSAGLGGGGSTAHGHGQGGGSATLSFRSDVMHRLARGAHPTVRRLG